MEFNKPTHKPQVATVADSLPEPYVDDQTTNGLGVKYVGHAEAGVSVEQAGWRIVKFETTQSGGSKLTTSKYPEGDNNFKFKWVDRLTYLYSR